MYSIRCGNVFDLTSSLSLAEVYVVSIWVRKGSSKWSFAISKIDEASDFRTVIEISV